MLEWKGSEDIPDLKSLKLPWIVFWSCLPFSTDSGQVLGKLASEPALGRRQILVFGKTSVPCPSHLSCLGTSDIEESMEPEFLWRCELFSYSVCFALYLPLLLHFLFTRLYFLQAHLYSRSFFPSKKLLVLLGGGRVLDCFWGRQRNPCWVFNLHLFWIYRSIQVPSLLLKMKWSSSSSSIGFSWITVRAMLTKFVVSFHGGHEVLK